jgi:hypothetical protein
LNVVSGIVDGCRVGLGVVGESKGRVEGGGGGEGAVGGEGSRHVAKQARTLEEIFAGIRRSGNVVGVNPSQRSF